MTYKYATLFKWINVVTDYFLLNLAFCLSFMLLSTNSFWSSASDSYRLYFLLLNLFWFFCSSLVRLYDSIMTRDAVSTLKAGIIGVSLFLVAPVTVTLLLPRSNLPVEFVFLAHILFVAFLMSWKFTFLAIRRSRRTSWISYQKVVIVGAGHVGIELYKYIQDNPQLGYKVDGIFDDNPLKVASDSRVIGRVDECFNYVLAHGISEIISALPMQELDKTKLLMEQADKHMVRFRMVPHVKTFIDKDALPDQYGYLPILTARREPLDSKANEIVKRGFDVFFSLFVIVTLLSWLLPLLAIAIKLDSKGPVFFAQLRSGKGNKPFYCLKLRSMYVNDEADLKQATKFDRRVTRIGAILRKSSMDELPQFFNVLMGHMSVVGPRPHMLKHTEDYSVLINNFMVRHFLTPGITGWAQVSGFRGEIRETTAISKRVEADLWYLENWSLLLDFKIILLTLWQAFRGSENAY